MAEAIIWFINNIGQGAQLPPTQIADLRPTGDLSNLIFISEVVKMPTENHVCLSWLSLPSSFIVYTEEHKNGRGFPTSYCHSQAPITQSHCLTTPK